MSDDLITWLTTHGDTVEVYEQTWEQSPDGLDDIAQKQWRFRVRAANQKIVEQGSEGYTRKARAIKAAERHHPRIEVTEP